MSDPISRIKSNSGEVDASFVDRTSYGISVSNAPSLAMALATQLGISEKAFSMNGTGDADSTDSFFGALASHPLVLHSFAPRLSDSAEPDAVCEVGIYRENYGGITERYDVTNGKSLDKDIFLGVGDGVFVSGKGNSKVRFNSANAATKEELPVNYCRYFGKLMQIHYNTADSEKPSIINDAFSAAFGASLTPIEIQDGVNVYPEELELLREGGYYLSDGSWTSISTFDEYVFPTGGVVSCLNFVNSAGDRIMTQLHFVFLDKDMNYIGGCYTNDTTDNLVYPVAGTEYVGIPLTEASRTFNRWFITGEYDASAGNPEPVGIDLWKAVSSKGGSIAPNTTNRTYISFGDSITYGQTSGEDAVRAEKPWPNRVAEVLGLNLSNVAEGGMGLLNTAYNSELAIDKVKATDMRAAALITVAFGRNDGAQPLGTSDDESGAQTICGQLKAIFDYIRSNSNLYVQVICISPTRAAKDFNEEAGSGGWTITGDGANSYEHQVGKVCEEYNVPLIGWSDMTMSSHWTDVCSDNVHPSSRGYLTMGAYMAGRISRYFL